MFELRKPQNVDISLMMLEQQMLDAIHTEHMDPNKDCFDVIA